MEKAESWGKRLFGRPLFWLTIIFLVAGFQIVRAVVIGLPPLPEVYGELPAFELTDQMGRRFGSRELEGRVWIANFIFTRCPTVCPVFTEKMSKLQHRVKNATPALHLVSFSVDPEHDTPEVLFAYARKHKASERMWSFLTGAPETVRATVRDGLKIAWEDQGIIGDVPDILHGTHFVLVDQRARIRGYYDSDDAAAVDRMLRDAGSLLNRRE